MSSVARAQADSLKSKARRYELGMNLYASSIRGGDHYSAYRRVNDHYVFNGLYMKYYFGQNALRVSANYMQKLVNNNKAYTPLPAGRIISSRTAAVSIGYQRLFGHRKLVPYLSCDLGAEYLRELRSFSHYYYLPYYHYADIAFPENGMFTSLLLGASPGIGLRMHLGRGVVLTAETQAQFYYALESAYRSTTGNKMIGVSVKPFLLSLGFMF